MSEAVSIYANSETSAVFRVAAPHLGDDIGGALHRAYDDDARLPDDMLYILERLDRID